jgi:hypothetical protein
MIVNTTRRAKTKILEDKPTEAELLASEETQATESDTDAGADTESTDDLVSEATEDADASEETQAAPQPQEMPLWCVEVKCPTPLAQNPKTIHAIDEETAWQVFCLQNGISGTDHPKTITRV